MAEDRITSLPDCVLGQILSYLPTKTMVATSILSSRWRHIWKNHLTVTDLSDDLKEDDLINGIDLLEHFIKFSVFVNTVFSLRRPFCPIQKMSLSCGESIFNHELCISSLNTWLSYVIGLHLKELNISMCPLVRKYRYHFHPSIALNACTNLVSLSLLGKRSIRIDTEFAEGIRLPSLKNLKLLDTRCSFDIHKINALLFGCPILETLDIYLHYHEQNKLHCKLRLPYTLKKLKITNVTSRLEMNLHSLSFDDLNTNTFGYLQNVAKASLDVFPCPRWQIRSLASRLITFLNALSGMKHLSLSLLTTKLLLGDPKLCLPEFHHLLHLELILPWFNPNFLLSLLQTCPILQVLMIQNDKEESPLQEWTTLSIVPNCFVSHLTHIQFKGYQGFPDELLFSEYILQNGSVLKTMIIADISLDKLKKNDILQRLSNAPRASRLCQLTFD